MARNMYVVTVNVPGFMPESEPVECADWADALATLRGELETTLETVFAAEDDDAGDDAWDVALAALATAKRERRAPLTIMLGRFAHNVDRLDRF